MKTTALQRARLLLCLLCLVAVAGTGCKSRQAKIARFHERAEAHFKAGDYNKAEIEFINVLRLENREVPEVIRKLGLIYEAQGKLAKAYAFLEKAKTLLPDDLELRAKLARVYLANRAFTNALDEIAFVLDKQPAHQEALGILPDTAYDTNSLAMVRQRLEALRPQAENTPAFHIALGKLHYNTREFAKSLAAYSRALELNPKSASAHWGAGGAYLSLTNQAKAEEMFKAAEALTPVRALQRLNYARLKILSGDAAAGRKILETMVEKAPDYLPALNQLATLSLAETNFTECASLVEKVLLQDSINFDAMMLNARLRLAEGKTAQAIEQLTKLIETYPGAVMAYFHRAVAHVVNNQPDQAIRDLKQITSVSPDYADAVFMLADLQIRANDPASAVVGLTAFLERYPNAARAQFLMARAYHALARSDDAMAICRPLAEQWKNEPQVPLLAGVIARQQKKNAEARAFFERTLQIAPDHLAALNQLLRMDVDDQDWDGALKRLQGPMARQPQSAELNLMLGVVYEAKGDHAQAEAVLLKATDFKPESGAAYQALAKLYLKTKQPAKAVAILEKCVAANPKNLDAFLLKALIHEQNKEYDKARLAYEQILEVNPNVSSVQNNLAYLLSERLGETDKAFELAQAARKMNPNDPALADTLGWLHYKRGEYAAALPLLTESAQKLATEPEVQFHLGLTAYMMGQEKVAQTALQTALQATNAFAGRVEAQERLALLAIDATKPDSTTAAVLQKALTERPNDPVAAIRLGAIHEQAKAWDKARQTYEKALETNPKLVPVISRLANLYAEPLKDSRKALELAGQARDLAPEDPNVAYLLGRVAYQNQDYTRAISLLRESALKLTGQSEVLFDLAWGNYSVGNVPEAVANMQAALKAQPAWSRADSAKQFLAMTDLASDPAKAVAAAAQVQQILKEQPDYVPALMAGALIYRQQNNLDAAKQAAERALARFPTFTPANRLLALLHLQNPPDYAKAHEHALKAREAFPADAEVARALGITTYQRKDYRQSVQLLNQSAAKLPNDADVFYFLGMGHYQLKEHPECKAALTKALLLEPNAPMAAAARKLLSELQ